MKERKAKRDAAAKKRLDKIKEKAKAREEELKKKEQKKSTRGGKEKAVEVVAASSTKRKGKGQKQDEEQNADEGAGGRDLRTAMHKFIKEESTRIQEEKGIAPKEALAAAREA